MALPKGTGIPIIPPTITNDCEYAIIKRLFEYNERSIGLLYDPEFKVIRQERERLSHHLAGMMIEYNGNK